MRCPYCGSDDIKVLETRESGGTIRRRRECLSCGKRFTTYERIETTPIVVVKKDGRREQFDPQKILRGILKACEKRPVSREDIEKIVEIIQEKLMGREEVSSQEIGELVMEELKKLDKVAYIRFASVYKEFKDVKEFEKLLKKLEKEKKKRKIKKVRKRDGSIVDFDKEKIVQAIWKAAQAVGGKDYELARKLADEVVELLEERFSHRIPSVEDIQDVIEKVLVENGHYRTAKAFILYRQQKAKIRETKNIYVDVINTINEYLLKTDWRVWENSNQDYSFSGLMLHISGKVIANYTLNHVYTPAIAEAHKKGYFHIHDLSHGIVGYCAGWSLQKLILEGFGGVPNKTDARPAKHLDSLVHQMVNFLGCTQMEFAGAQSFSSVDTLLAPFVKVERLNYKQVKQAMQELVYSLNIPSRWGCQYPFTNLTFDLTPPEDLAEVPAIVGGKPQDFTYGECQDEMDMINKAFLEVMCEGDAKGRIFTFPIPTYNLTKDFDWDSEIAQLLFEVTGKYGIPYFQNYIGGDLEPNSVRAMCCRLQLDKTQLYNKGNGLFGAGEQTGSIGVVTINVNRLAYEARGDVDKYFNLLRHYMLLAKDSLEIKRRVVSKNLENGLMPYTKRYLGSFRTYFSTIGLVGMNEACLNLLEVDIAHPEGKKLAKETLLFMRKMLQEFQKETGNLYNLEATPAESASYRLARLDKEMYPGIITAGKKVPYLTNSTQLPVGYTDNLWFALEHQSELQPLYTGGTVFHVFLAESIDGETCRKLVKKIAYNTKLPYFSITPTFSICPVHGYIPGKHEKCPVVVG